MCNQLLYYCVHCYSENLDWIACGSNSDNGKEEKESKMKWSGRRRAWERKKIKKKKRIKWKEPKKEEIFYQKNKKCIPKCCVCVICVWVWMRLKCWRFSKAHQLELVFPFHILWFFFFFQEKKKLKESFWASDEMNHRYIVRAIVSSVKASSRSLRLLCSLHLLDFLIFQVRHEAFVVIDQSGILRMKGLETLELYVMTPACILVPCGDYVTEWVNTWFMKNASLSNWMVS